MLGLRLDESVRVDAPAGPNGLDRRAALERLTAGGLVARVAGGIRLTGRGRLLGGAVTAELLA